MKKTLLKALMLMAVLVLSNITYAVPADPKPITITQSNGKSLTFYLKGDEKLSWAVTEDGYTLLKDTDGNWVYAMKNNMGYMVASNVLAANPNQRSIQDTKFLTTVEKNLKYSTAQKQIFDKLLSSKLQTKYSQGRFPANGGSTKLLVILVNFSDLSFSTDKSVFENMCMQDNYNGTGSIHQYFYTNSNGNLDLQIDVVGPVTLPNSMAYYGGHETVSYGGTSYTYKDKNTKAFVEHTIQKAASQVNFSQYDNDGDGIVDDVAIIYAGTPESSTGNEDEIWPHSSEAQMTTLYNGVKINRYTCSAEKPDQTIGTFCHEFGHALGLPDEYDTDYEETNGTSVTVGSWSVMCEGSYNNNSNSPCLWSAMQKNLVGWIDTVIMLGGTMDSLRLPAITGTNDTAYQVYLSGTEFLMIEHRKKQGFDAYIPGEGLLIYHGQMNKINSWVNYGSNKINVDPNDRGWFIEPADGNLSSTTKAAAAFPGTKNITYFLSPTLVKGGTVDSVNITNIGYLNDSVMTFSYNPSTPIVQTSSTTQKKASSLTVSGKLIYKNDNTPIASKGFVYSLDEDCPYVTTNVVMDSDLTDSININATIIGLTNSTTYYFKAFVTDNSGNMYFGNIAHAKTSSGLGYVLTKEATNVDSTSATLNGSVESLGQGDFIEKGFVYIVNNSSVLPSIDSADCFKVLVEGDTIGAYSVSLEGLAQGTTCYYRAFLTNSYGTYYDNATKNFQTLYPSITNNIIASSQQICSGSTPEELTGSEAEGGFGEFTYLWQQKSGYSSWSNAEGTNNEKNYQPSALTATTSYRRIAYSVGIYENISNEITIEVSKTKAGTLSSSKSKYDIGDEVKLTLSNYSGSIIDWYMGDSENDMIFIGNAGLAVYKTTFDEAGVKYFQVKVQAGVCEPALTAVKKITIVDPSSIEDVTDNSSIQIMPNPTNGRFTIVSNITNAENISIVNELGQVVYSMNNVDLTNKTIDLENQPMGTYIIKIMSDNQVKTIKLIINK